MKGSLARGLDRLASSFWALPALFCVLALALALSLPELDERVSQEIPYLFPGGPDGARVLLSAIVTAMISFTGLVFSITIVALQLASSQFSPRVLRTFLRSRTTQLALGVFTGTFVYALGVLRSIRGQFNEISAFVPQLSVTAATIFVLCSVAMFVVYIHSMTQSIRISRIVHAVGDEARDVLQRQEKWKREVAPEPPPALPTEPVMSVWAEHPGVIVRVDHERLVELARKARGVIVQPVEVGTFLPGGCTALELYPDGTGTVQADARVLRRAVHLDVERTMEQDLAFGIRQLVDIAERALSPSLNDPTTAVQSLDEIHDLLRRVVQRPNPGSVWRDSDGAIRLITTEPTVAGLVDLALDEILQYGSGSLQVHERARRMLVDLLEVSLPAHRPQVAAKLHHLNSFPDPAKAPA